MHFVFQAKQCAIECNFLLAYCMALNLMQPNLMHVDFEVSLSMELNLPMRVDTITALAAFGILAV